MKYLWELASEVGQKRRFGAGPITSGVSQSTDMADNSGMSEECQ
jgi:hypothetical protein